MSSDSSLSDTTPHGSTDGFETAAQREPSDWLRWLGERRDGFLVGGAVLYGLGYLVWSYNAWRNELGQLPAAEFQYFMAGLVPAAIIATAWAGAVFFAKLQHKADELSKQSRHFATYSFFVTMALMLLPFLARFAEVRGWIAIGLTDHGQNLLLAPLVVLAQYLMLVTGLGQGHNRHRYWRWYTRVSQYLIPLTFVVASSSVYFEIYPRLPQALGGPEPRCAYVDLVRDQLAPASLSLLASGQEIESLSNVVRSEKLRVYFSSNDHLLIRKFVDGSADQKGDTALFELRNDVIRVVHWCAS